MVKLLDLESLEYVKDSFIDKDLKEYFSDLLLKVYLKKGLPACQLPEARNQRSGVSVQGYTFSLSHFPVL